MRLVGRMRKIQWLVALASIGACGPTFTVQGRLLVDDANHGPAQVTRPVARPPKPYRGAIVVVACPGRAKVQARTGSHGAFLLRMNEPFVPECNVLIYGAVAASVRRGPLETTTPEMTILGTTLCTGGAHSCNEVTVNTVVEPYALAP